MNAYEQKQEERRQRYMERADRLRQEAAQLLATARKMGDAIPFGQPILTDHYSARRDRAYRAKLARKYEKSFETSQQANHYAQKAASVGSGGISSDDPDAIDKLREKLAAMEAEQAMMVAANKIIRKFFAKRDLTDAEKLKADIQATLPSLTALGLSESAAVKLFMPDFGGRRGYPGYALSNNSGNMARVRERIADLERREQLRETLAAESESNRSQVILKSETVNGLTIEFNLTENRLLLFFPGKPSEAVRSVCKRNGFRWSPTRGAWSRSLGGWAESAAEAVKAEWLKQ